MTTYPNKMMTTGENKDYEHGPVCPECHKEAFIQVTIGGPSEHWHCPNGHEIWIIDGIVSVKEEAPK